MPLRRRHDLIDEAKTSYRSGDYQHVRDLIARHRSSGTATEAAALHYIDECAAKLLNVRIDPYTPRFDVSESSSDDAVYFRALAAWLDSDLSKANTLLREHRPHSNDAAASFSLLRGWIFGARSRFPEQASITRTALESLLRDPDADGYLIANAAFSLAALAREMPSVSARVLLEQALERIPQEHYPTHVLHVRRALGNIEALHGRHTIALRHLTLAGENVASPIERAFLYFDYALVALWARQSAVAEASFSVGASLTFEIDFASRMDESVFVLTVGAVAGATIDQEMAHALAVRAAGILPTLSPRWGNSHGPRSQALADEALALTTADTEEALTLGTSAGNAFEKIGYFWRAGRLANVLFERTGYPAYRHRAERLLASPDGQLAIIVQHVPLSPRQRQILALLRDGKRTDQIAEAINIAPGTVCKHITRLHQRYGVSRRAELLAAVSGDL